MLISITAKDNLNSGQKSDGEIELENKSRADPVPNLGDVRAKECDMLRQAQHLATRMV